jgi:hypothetical protein
VTIIILPGKIAGLICISRMGFCVEEDSRCRGQENIKLPEGMAGVFHARKYRYPLDMEGFWLRDNCRIIAGIFQKGFLFFYSNIYVNLNPA